MKKTKYYSDSQMLDQFVDCSISGEPLSSLYNDPRCQPKLRDGWIDMEAQLGVAGTEKLLHWGDKPRGPQPMDNIVDCYQERRKQ